MRHQHPTAGKWSVIGPLLTRADGTPPKPLDRQVKPGMVRVRAEQAVGLEIDGVMCGFEKGEVFDCPADRIAQLGKLVIPAEDFTSD
jgi:hypothetical protein